MEPVIGGTRGPEDDADTGHPIAGERDRGQEPAEGAQAFDDLLEAVIRDQVKRIPRWRRGGQAARTTELVNETWLKVSRHDEYRSKPLDELGRILKTTVDRVLIDQHRHRNAQCRGVQPDVLDTDPAGATDRAPDLRHDVAIALDALEQEDARLAMVFSLRRFCDAPPDAIAKRLDVSTRTVFRLLDLAEAWMNAYLADRGYDGTL